MPCLRLEGETMITNEERREVAEKLRKLAGTYVTLGDLQEALEIDLTSPDVDIERDAKNLNRLADLIEPEPELTCRNLADTKYKDMPEDVERWYLESTPRNLGICFLCSNCGAEVTDSESYHSAMYVNGVATEFKRCPNCEAKVVE